MLELLLDANEPDGDVFDGESSDLCDLVVGGVFEPEKYDSSVEESETMDAVVEHTHLREVFLVGSEEVDVHLVFLARAIGFFLTVKAGVHCDTPNP